ncbi:MAG: hypothetical protein NVSMB57_09940 [Actinomycetota bacterium]
MVLASTALCAGFAIAPAAHASRTASVSVQQSAAINGFARASAIFVPLSVNPNFDFWPVYSLSETDGSLSHGISAGFWPGFLADATFFQFGYQPAERAFFGAAESAYPIGPVEDAAGSTDFARDCAAGRVSKLPLPLNLGDAAAPEPLMTGCQSLYTQYRSRVPYSAESGSTVSDNLRSEGSANGVELRAGSVTAGSAYATSYTNGSNGSATFSGATVILSDVHIGPSLRLKESRSSVRAVATGKQKGMEAERSITIVEARSGDMPVVIDDHGVSTLDGKPLNDVLAAQGLQVRVVNGTTTRGTNESAASSGALIVRATRESSGALPGTEKSCGVVSGVAPSPVATVSQTIAPNPLYSPRPPYDQLPQSIGINEKIVPSIPCPLLLLDRSVDAGIALGGAVASARFQPLPGVAEVSGGPTKSAQQPQPGSRPVSAGSRGAFTLSHGGGSLLPSFGNTPPVPLKSILKRYVFEGLGIAEARGVKALYGGIVLIVLGMVVGRRVFKALMRA